MTVPSDADPNPVPVHLRRDLVARGWTDRMLDRAVRRGELARPRRGAYVDGPTFAASTRPARHRLTARAVLAASPVPLVVSHASALAFHGGPDWGLDLDVVDVTRPDRRCGRSEAGVRQHRGRLLDGDVCTLGGVPVTSAARAALELTTQVDLETAVVHIDDLIRRGLTTGEELAARYATGMVHWPRSVTTDLALRLADGRSESVAESRFRMLAWREHLPRPDAQVLVTDHRGRVVARLDFAWPEHRVFLEVDGRAKYTTLLGPAETVQDVVLAEKRREDLVRRLTGWRCVRIGWADLDRPAATAAMIRRVLDEMADPA